MPSSDPAAQVLELSVDETNKLRAELGLAPLRGVTSKNQNQTKEQEEQLELSVDDTNALRERLGLAPLRNSSKRKEVHAPAANQGDQNETKERLERARVEREVRQGIAGLVEKEKPLGEEDDDEEEDNVTSWAQRMRASAATKQQAASSRTTSQQGDGKKKGKRKKGSSKNKEAEYDETDLHGLKVAHALSELEEGTTTVLTLADTSLLKTRDDDTSGKVLGLADDDDDDNNALENVNLAEQQKRQHGLREKRKLELGLGRAGGYSGFDDDEFQELGGSQMPSRAQRSSDVYSSSNNTTKKKKVRGFQIGALLEDQQAFEQEESDLFSAQEGKAISLEPTKADAIASDFMTLDEDQAERVERKKKKKTKDDKDDDNTGKFKKKKKKDKKKKKQHRKVESDDDDDDDVEEETVNLASSSKGLLEELEETAVATVVSRKKRRRTEDREGITATAASKTDATSDAMDVVEEEKDNIDKGKAEKRAKFDAVMAKGNERTRKAFHSSAAGSIVQTNSHADLDEGEPDDAFLNAALAKARRLNRLRQIAAESKQQQPVRGADAVVEAVLSSQKQQQQLMGVEPDAAPSSSSTTGTVTFAIDETREFTRALRARAEQVDRDQAKKAAAAAAAKNVNGTAASTTIKNKPIIEPIVKMEQDGNKEEEEDDDVEEEAGASLAELARHVKDDDNDVALDGTSTGSAVAVGRGLGGVLDMLRQTGELTRKNAGKEEMRGRAKDKRTYEDYEALDLRQVVKIDERTATDKDKELAHREVKLEYRDKHGRLLTRKEAFRDLSYQFHGYGSGKRKDTKRKEQIAREQAEARLASRQAAEGAGVGTFGALKATQKATGKAFVVHKT